MDSATGGTYKSPRGLEALGKFSFGCEKFAYLG
jgi:hypothetical protein